ncbi:MAG TPA: deoxyribose-phosphate aldolase [Terriglobales bacterium]|nr:deoxyribose-phosphate aldolase [Terriglobales bacterium]
MSTRHSQSPHAENSLTSKALAKIIDHTHLRPDATREQIASLCDEAKQYGFGAVMVNACYVELACSKLNGADAKVGAVIGFPLGATLTSVKVYEAKQALRLGAREIDMVLNVGGLKSADQRFVAEDIRAVAEVVHGKKALLKVILETVLLTEEEKVTACRLSARAGADFVKTSTGFLGGGATVADVELMRRTVGTKLGVKASGGIRSAEDARKMIEAGANRLGTSSGVTIVREWREQSES